MRSRGEATASARDEVIAVARRMSALGLVTGTFGNVSRRLNARILITPSGLDYETMRRQDLVVLDAAGIVVEGENPPSSEYRLHVAIYRELREVRAIVHTHSPFATARGDSTAELSVPDGRAVRGPVPVAPHRLPGTQELADEAARLLRERSVNAVILRRHGVVGIGRDLHEALRICVEVERIASRASA